MLMRIFAILIVLAFAAVPAALAEDSPDPAQASALCKQQRAAIGTSAFAQLYGGAANAYGRCVSKLASAAAGDKANAAKRCSAESADASFATTHDGKTFEQFYGSGKNGHNAFGKCVSQQATTLTQERQDATISAAKTCKKERTTLGVAAFTAKYGNRTNAFGRCVSKIAHAQP
jgi:hypothetical protein